MSDQTSERTDRVMTIQTVRINGKHLSHTLFEQLSTEDIIDADSLEVRGKPLACLNTHTPACKDLAEHVHVLWEKEGDLRVCPVFLTFCEDGRYRAEQERSAQFLNDLRNVLALLLAESCEYTATPTGRERSSPPEQTILMMQDEEDIYTLSISHAVHKQLAYLHLARQQCIEDRQRLEASSPSQKSAQAQIREARVHMDHLFSEGIVLAHRALLDDPDSWESGENDHADMHEATVGARQRAPSSCISRAPLWRRQGQQESAVDTAQIVTLLHTYEKALLLLSERVFQRRLAAVRVESLQRLQQINHRHRDSVQHAHVIDLSHLAMLDAAMMVRDLYEHEEVRFEETIPKRRLVKTGQNVHLLVTSRRSMCQPPFWNGLTQEPLLERCPYCLMMHVQGSMEQCPKNPHR